MILRAAVMPTIQIVVAGNLVSPVSAPPPPPTAASTALGKSEIVKYTKHRVLPDPDSPELALVEENSATRVLAAAIYLKIENLFSTKHRPDWNCNGLQVQHQPAN